MPSLTQQADSDGATVPGECLHRMRVVGRLRVGERSGLDCDQPLLAVCRSCGHSDHWRCKTYQCGPCGETKRRHLQRVIEDGSATHLANGLFGYFLTLTAPGDREHLRWYQGKKPRHRKACACHDHGLTDGTWNRQESACWNRLRTSLSRDGRVIFAGSVETQKRGLLHRHVVLFSDRVLTHAEVQDLALTAGYGCVLDVEPLQSAQKAARYLSKYVTKSSSERPDVPWTKISIDYDTGELVEVGVKATFRLWSSSRKWGVTMSEVRQVAGDQARARARYLEDLVQAMRDEAAAASGNPDTATNREGPPI